MKSRMLSPDNEGGDARLPESTMDRTSNDDASHDQITTTGTQVGPLPLTIRPASATAVVLRDVAQPGPETLNQPPSCQSPLLSVGGSGEQEMGKVDGDGTSTECEELDDDFWDAHSTTSESTNDGDLIVDLSNAEHDDSAWGGSDLAQG